VRVGVQQSAAEKGLAALASATLLGSIRAVPASTPSPGCMMQHRRRPQGAQGHSLAGCTMGCQRQRLRIAAGRHDGPTGAPISHTVLHAAF
jgi:hypothetical protein